MSSPLLEIETIFAALQNGIVKSHEHRDKSLVLIVGCEFLAGVIEKGKSNFEVEIHNIKKFGFEPWTRENVDASGTLVSPEEIFCTEMEIFDAEKSKGHTKVYLRHEDEAVDHIGGILKLTGDQVDVRIQNGESITPDALKLASDKYWKEQENQE